MCVQSGAKACVIAVGLFANCFGSLSADERASVEARLRSDLTFLSSDELQGRDVGSEGIAKAGEFIAARFSELGFQTDNFDGKPFQDFNIPGRSKLGPAVENTLTLIGVEGLPALKLEENFCPMALGTNGEFEGELVFVGFGITAKDLEYDDYANLDVTGKVVIALRKEPQQNDENSRFDGTQNTPFALFTTKQMNAAVHKVAALILVNDNQTVERGGDQLMQVGEANGPGNLGSRVPTIFCSREVIEPLIQKSLGKSIETIQSEIDATGKPQSAVLTGLRASGSVSIKNAETIARNVVGFLPGRGDLSDEFVVVGAHYDHVGMGGPGSLAPGTIAVHNGADDNSSGTTTMLEIARRLSHDDKSQERRGVVFIAFSGEERGLLGSKHYVRNPRWALENTVAMVNLDMVGRLTSNALTVYGTGTATGFDELIDRLNERTKFALDKQVAGYGPSDHQSFYEVGIPVFHFFTGLHNEYHRPSDDIELINFEGMQRIADMTSDLVLELATRPDRPELQKISAVADVGRRNRGTSGRLTLGIMMDANSQSVLVQSVTPGSAAEKAGIQPGDGIGKMDDEVIRNSADLRNFMGRKKLGDTITVTVLRNGQEVPLQVKLGK
jgi:Peptidase family M28/PDZ domain/PA domain